MRAALANEHMLVTGELPLALVVKRQILSHVDVHVNNNTETGFSDSDPKSVMNEFPSFP